MALALSSGFLALLAYIAWWDLRAFRIPDHATLPLALGGVFWAVLAGSPEVHFASAVIVGAIFLGLARGYETLRDMDGLGLGDIKLAAAGALWIGPGIASGVAIGAGAALAVTLARAAMGRQSMAEPVPFGAYLALGICAVFFFL